MPMWLCQHGFTAAQRDLVLAATSKLCELEALTRGAGALPCLELGARLFLLAHRYSLHTDVREWRVLQTF